MGNAIVGLAETARERLIDLVHASGPWALPGLGAAGILLAVAFRDRLVSAGGLIVILMLLALGLVIRAVQLGRL